MTAAMNGSINLSIPDGWVPGICPTWQNCFSIEPADRALAPEEQDRLEAERLYEMLGGSNPTYYRYPDAWYAIMRQSWKDGILFCSGGWPTNINQFIDNPLIAVSPDRRIRILRRSKVIRFCSFISWDGRHRLTTVADKRCDVFVREFCGNRCFIAYLLTGLRCGVFELHNPGGGRL